MFDDVCSVRITHTLLGTDHMPDKGVNSTFKKIVYESSELVFLADDTYPYTIFYANELFEKEIGEKLEQRNLVGLGLDVNSYIFKEELVLEVQQQEYSFLLELPHENESNYFLFYRGKLLDEMESPTKAEAVDYICTNSESIAIGEFDFFTFLNAAALTRLGYKSEELVNTNLLPFLHGEDRADVVKTWNAAKIQQKPKEIEVRFLTKSQEYLKLWIRISFSGERFFITSLPQAAVTEPDPMQAVQNELIQSEDELVEVGKWHYQSKEREFHLDEMATKVLGLSKKVRLDKKKTVKPVRKAFKMLAKDFDANTKGQCILNFGTKYGYKVSWSKENVAGAVQVAGIVWSEERGRIARQEADFLRALFMESPEAMIMVKGSRTIEFINSEARKLFDFSEATLPVNLNELVDLVVGGEQADSWPEISVEENTERTTIIQKASGDTLTLAIKSKPIPYSEEGCVVVSFRNVTEKIILERSLEDSTDFLMNLTDQVPGGLYQMVLSSEGEIRFAFLSKGIESVLGISNEQAQDLKHLGAAMSNVHPADLPNVVMTSIASAKKMEPWNCQFRVKVGDKSEYRWVLGAARPQIMDSGEMVWYGYLTDISLQKEFEERLDEAKRAAEKANQIKSDFLSMISHELRTPLNAISGSVYSLHQESPSDYQKNALNTISFAVDNLIIMINDLLDFQKIEAGKLHVEKASFNLSELLNQIIKGLTFHARDSKNKLKLDLDPQLDLAVLGDKTRVSQVLNNLITNALKFTNKGVVELKAHTVYRTDQKIRVYFEVLDNGIGIAPEDQTKIFNDFDQVKPTFNKKYGGTGLGLSITRKLLMLMGGEIFLESAVGEGSKFFFELELDIAQGQPALVPDKKSKSTFPEKLHLLMAEDNEVNALVLGKIISKWGYTYDRVVNGKEAVRAMSASHNYHCILMDIQMPEMNGFDATVAIKASYDIPVIALTAAAKLEIMEQIKQCGFDGFVAKPIDAAELQEAIKAVVEKYHYKS